MEAGRQRWRTGWTDDRKDEVRGGEEGKAGKKKTAADFFPHLSGWM